MSHLLDGKKQLNAPWQSYDPMRESSTAQRPTGCLFLPTPDKKRSATLEKNDEKHVLIPGEIEPGTSFEKPSVNVQIQQ